MFRWKYLDYDKYQTRKAKTGIENPNCLQQTKIILSDK